MADTVRISPNAHKTLAELARQLHLPRTEVLSRAIEEYRKSVFFERLREGYAAVSATERAEDRDDVASWDATLSDGLEDA